MAKQFDPRKFMELAIEIMKKSITESRDDKAVPKVGAVLVSDAGEILGTAYRGELRDGDHAEYTLIDRKLRDKDVSGAYLFATLEPCADGARKHPKIECAQRIVNARIKKVWVGIEDPDPTVDRKGIKFLMDSGIEVEMFPKDLQDIIEEENKDFLKGAILRRTIPVPRHELILTPLEKAIEATMNDELSKDALQHYINRADLKMRPDSPEFLALLERQQLILLDKQSAPNAVDEARRNDIIPIFSFNGGGHGSGTIDSIFINNGDRANIMSFREYADNQSNLFEFKKGVVDKGMTWNLSASSKTGEREYTKLGYHIEVLFKDKDGREYAQEILYKGGRTDIFDPVLINTTPTQYKPTGLGILLFGKSPRLRYPQAVLKVEVRYGSGEPEIHDFDDALILVPDRVEEWLKRVLSSKISRENFARNTEYSYPIGILREIIINAIVHRDYDIEGAKCYLIIDDDKIIVRSPGLPVKPIKFEDFKTFTAPSLSRNPKLMAVYSAMGYVEERGIGMREMKALPENYQLQQPEITWQEPYLTITLPRAKKNIAVDLGVNLNEEEQNGLLFVKGQKEVSRAEYAAHFKFNDKKAQRQLAKLVELELIKLVGKGPSARYVYNSDIDS